MRSALHPSGAAAALHFFNANCVPAVQRRLTARRGRSRERIGSSPRRREDPFAAEVARNSGPRSPRDCNAKTARRKPSEVDQN